jgi:hypothetical protein
MEPESPEVAGMPGMTVGQVIVGAVWSITTTLKLQVEAFPAASTAV